MDEMILLARLRQRDPDALFFLYNEYRDRVFAVVRRVVRDDWDAEEVVQDVFWTVHRKIQLFREDSALWSWIYRIAVNAAKMKVRKYKRYPIPVEEELLRDMHSKEEGDDLSARPDQQFLYKRLIEEMSAYLDSLSETNRALYLGMEIEGMSKEDIAQMLDLTVPAVKTRLHRLRVGLREHITDLYPSHDLHAQ